jgi:putative ABC transport system permease protein
MFRYFSLVIAYTLRNRRRSALAAVSISVALCLLTMLAASYRVLFQESDANPREALRMMTQNKISITQPMPVSYRARIRQIPGVRNAMVWQWFGGTYKDARDARNFFGRYAIEPAKLFSMRPEIELPDEEKQSFQRKRTACIAGSTLSARFGWKKGDRITLMGDIFPVTLELTLVGIYRDPSDDETLYLNYDYLREAMQSAGLGPRADQVGVFLVQAESADRVIGVSAAIDEEFENSPAPTETQPERNWLLGFVAFLGNLKLYLLSICAALAFTILLVSTNTITMAVRERIRDVGILKTLGYTPAAILGLTIAEATALAVAGGAGGLLLAAGLCAAVSRSGTAYAALQLAVTPGIAAGSLIAAAVLGISSSLWPAWQASRTGILDALRSTE